MRAGLPFSIAIHLGLAFAGMVVIPTLQDEIEPTPMVILPVELLTIADTTNLAPIAEAPKPDADDKDEAAPVEASPAPAQPQAEAEPIPDVEAPPPPKKKEEEVKAEPKPAPPKKESFEDSLDSILKSVDKPKKAAPADQKTATNLKTVEDAAARRGVGDMKRMTITVADFIRDQMLRKGCWADQDDMPDAKRLRATFRIKFGRDGHFLSDPQLVEPGRLPFGDKPMEVFVARAQAGLNKCNQLGFQVPAEYYEHQPAQWIDIVFLP